MFFFLPLINPKSSGRLWNPCVEIRYANSLSKKAAKLMCTFLLQLTDIKKYGFFFPQRINNWKFGRDFFSLHFVNKLIYFLLMFFSFTVLWDVLRSQCWNAQTGKVTSLNFDLLSASTQANSSGMGVKSCSRGDNYVNQEYVKHSYSVM